MVLLLTVLSAVSLLSDATATCDVKAERYPSGSNHDVAAAQRFLEDSNARALEMSNKVAIATWGYESNLTETNKDIMLKMQEEEATLSRELFESATKFAWKSFSLNNYTMYRWFKKNAILDTAALSQDKFSELNEITADMQDIYGKAKLCPYNAPPSTPCDLNLEPEVTDIMRTSRKNAELVDIWKQWRDATGRKVKTDFLRYVQLSNEAACLNGFEDAGEVWREAFETPTFRRDVEDLWTSLQPLYLHLHAYVRRMLSRRYPDSGIRADGPIPAHLLGNMWGQTWSNIFDIVKPYPNKEFVDVTETMRAKGLTPLKMFEISEEFFTSLGLIKMTPEFWNRSIIEKPKDREMVCHASAWDFYDGKDFRIKMCTSVNMEDLITVHHEMGHIEYYLQYRNQLQAFREGANDGFHEAVGDTLALSASTPGHLQKIGLLKDASDDYESDINSLMEKALEKIAFLPFGYLIDVWRWDVFSRNVSKDELNTKWWEFRLKYQGLCPPVERTEKDFDAGAKYHVVASVPYIRYFVSFVVQFQFHKSLCDEAGYEGPLHKCDIYQSKKAGKLLSDMLQLGSSVPWEEAMSVITKGKTSRMDASGIMEYFKPLMEWLKKQNANEFLGWNSKDAMICPDPLTP